MFETLARSAVVGSMIGLLRKVTHRHQSHHALNAAGLVALGIVAGAGAALLFAPKSGTELRGDLRRRAQQLSAGATERMERFRANKTQSVPDHV
jgi:hypothetical protein